MEYGKNDEIIETEGEQKNGEFLTGADLTDGHTSKSQGTEETGASDPAWTETMEESQETLWDEPPVDDAANTTESGYTAAEHTEPEAATPLGSTAYTNTTYTGGYNVNSLYGQSNPYQTGGAYGQNSTSSASGNASAAGDGNSGRAAYYSDAVYSPYAEGGKTKQSKQPKEKKEKNPDSFGRKLLRTVALALVFGLVAGLMFRFVGGVGFSGGNSAQVEKEEDSQKIETTLPAADANDDDGVVESTPASQISLQTDVSEIVKQTMPSIVQVSNISLIQYRSFFGQLRTYEVPSAGSGIIISEDDEYIYIATNNHVVANANELTITFCDDASVSAIIVGTDPEHDLAVVSVKLADVPAETLDAIRMAVIGDSDELIVGQGAIVIGNALGYGQSVTVGYISAKDREVTLQNDDGTEITNQLIQTDAAVNPGNSGGALLNMRGEVVGIVSAKYSDTQVEGMGYAIPITQAKDIIETIVEGGVPEQSTDSAGSTDLAPGTAYLGIYGMDLDEQTAEQYGMPTGVYVSRIIRGSAADAAGLNRGDVILSIDGDDVTSMEAVREYITGKKPGDTIEIVYSSWNSDYEEEETVTATLTAVPEE